MLDLQSNLQLQLLVGQLTRVIPAFQGQPASSSVRNIFQRKFELSVEPKKFGLLSLAKPPQIRPRLTMAK